MNWPFWWTIMQGFEVSVLSKVFMHMSSRPATCDTCRGRVVITDAGTALHNALDHYRPQSHRARDRRHMFRA